MTKEINVHVLQRGFRKFSHGGWGVGGVQIPRRGLTENFNMAEINKSGNSRGRVVGVLGLDPLSPLWIRPCTSMHEQIHEGKKQLIHLYVSILFLNIMKLN